MLALYRKYRPEKFKELVGQDHTKATLNAEVRHARLAHAYLFVGPRGTGKTSTARILAAAVNCAHPQEGEPCAKCDHCKAIRAGSYLDLIEIDAASQTGVDNVRENIIESARFVPQVGKWKIYIIDEAHMLSQAAWNALLKTLEEPPERVMFIFATTEPRKIPDTILSRCQQFRFRSVSHEVLAERLRTIAKGEDVTVEDSVIEEIALRTGGYIRDAESLLGQILSVGGKRVRWDDAVGILGHTPIDAIEEILTRLLQGDAAGSLTQMEEKREEGVDFTQLPGGMLDILRAMHYKAVTNEDHPVLMRRFGSEGLKATAALMKINSNAVTLRTALNTIVARQAVRDIPPELVLEILFAELAEIFAGDADQTPSSPSGKNREEKSLVSEKEAPTHRAPQSASVRIVKQGKSVDAKVDAGIKEKKDAPKSALKLELHAIKALWGAFVEKVNTRNHALPFILRSAEPLRVSENHIHVGVYYPFHYERLAEAQNRTIIEETLAELLGGPVVIQVELLKEEAAVADSSATDEMAVNQLVSLFGGKIVEG